MKGNKDVAKGWIIKAESDIENMMTVMKNGVALDTVCFHSQQGAEKYLKAFLTFNDVIPPKTHDIEELLDLCSKIDTRFVNLIEETVFLTDYAVESRYDLEFWPKREDVENAFDATNKIKQLVLSLLPEEMQP